MKEKEQGKPLLSLLAESYPNKLLLKYLPRGDENLLLLFELQWAKTLNPKDYDISFGIAVSPDEFTRYGFLKTYEGPAFVVHHRVLKMLEEFCPQDFQTIPVEIKNLNDKILSFKNGDYVIIKPLHKVHSIDYEKSIFTIDTIRGIKRLVLKENSMGPHHMALEADRQSLMLFSPQLVRKLRKFKGRKFVPAEEMYNEILPHEHLIQLFHENPEKAKMYLGRTMNSPSSYELLIRFIHEVPKEMLIRLIDMTLSRSSFHLNQCNEILEMIGEKPRTK